MQPLLYGELTPWYRLLDPVADHAEEAAAYAAMLAHAGAPTGGTLLELGGGAGGNAFFMKRDFRCTLTDIAPDMLALSRALNPECEHLPGDMRTLRLGRSFDAVLVHDAVCYMTTRADLAAAAATAFAHTRPGGAALFAPDYVRETFGERSELHAGDEGARSLRCLEWAWDPDPGDDAYTVEYAFLLRERNELKAVHDRHVEGLFPRAVWTDVLTAAGYRVELVDRPFDDAVTDAIFLCRRPA
ncbi:MAG TPA: class I SAM-dependent methyltransferase [Polyangia bacterium]|nr:class I SAM-dependent methyltransferase [Polyangia bacterium]